MNEKRTGVLILPGFGAWDQNRAPINSLAVPRVFISVFVTKPNPSRRFGQGLDLGEDRTLSPPRHAPLAPLRLEQPI